jgi:hypothetical protein
MLVAVQEDVLGEVHRPVVVPHIPVTPDIDAFPIHPEQLGSRTSGFLVLRALESASQELVLPPVA